MATNSQQSLTGFSQPQALALVKFSFATCSPDQRTPINWTHLPDRDNLHAVFDHVRVQRSSGQVEEKLVLKVVRGSEVMEDLDLNSLAREAQAGEEALRATSDSQAQSPVLVIVRSPCIAIRYPLPTRQSRRFQMRFKTEPDYYKALTVLSEAGFLLKQASATVPESRPQSSMQTRPVSSASMTDNSVKQSESQTSYSLQNIPAANGSQTYGHTTGQNMKLPVIFGQIASAETKPASSSSSCTITNTAIPEFPIPVLLPSPALKHTIHSPSSYSPTNEYLQMHTTAVANSPAKQSLEQFLQSESQQRPLNAPTDFLGISQAMPPRRELPFAKPLPRPSSKSSNRSSPIKKAPPTTDAADGSNQNLNLGGKKKTPRRPNTNGNKQSKEAGHVPTVEELLKMPTSPSVAPIEPRRSLATYKDQAFEAGTETSDDLTTSLKRPRQDLDGRFEPGRKRSMVLYDGVISPKATEAQPDSNGASSLARMSLDRRAGLDTANSDRQLLSSHSHSTSAVSRDPWGDAEMDLGAFVAMSSLDRQAEIEGWMCRQLLDPDFKAVCEDVEACWRRVLLGVK